MENKDMTPGMVVTHRDSLWTIVRPDSDRMVELYPGTVLPVRLRPDLRTWAWSSEVEPYVQVPAAQVVDHEVRKTLVLNSDQPEIHITDHYGKTWAPLRVKAVYWPEGFGWTVQCANLKADGSEGGKRKDFNDPMIANSEASAKIRALVLAFAPAFPEN